MKIAYLILAHNQPAHFQRLLRAILTPDSAAFVHIDAKSDIAPFKRGASPSVHFLESRVPVYWGEFSMVEAVLRLMRAALSAPISYDYLILISGSDYPIRSQVSLVRYLEQHAGREFINAVEMPNGDVSKPINRLTYYKVLSGSVWSIPLKIARRLLIHARLMPQERSFEAALNGLKPIGGSTWWALTNAACRYVLEFVDRETDFVRFFRNTWFPDEGMIHTIIGNSPFASNVRHNLTYTDWNAGGPHPSVIQTEHVHRFIENPHIFADDCYGSGELFFARKFRDEDAELTRLLDESMSQSYSRVANAR